MYRFSRRMSTARGSAEVPVDIGLLKRRSDDPEEVIPPHFSIVKMEISPVFVLYPDNVFQCGTDAGGIRGEEEIAADRRVPCRHEAGAEKSVGRIEPFGLFPFS